MEFILLFFAYDHVLNLYNQEHISDLSMVVVALNNTMTASLHNKDGHPAASTKRRQKQTNSKTVQGMIDKTFFCIFEHYNFKTLNLSHTPTDQFVFLTL